MNMFSANRDIGREEKENYYDKDYFENSDVSGYIDGYQYENYKSYFDNIAKFIVEKFQPESVLDIGCAKGYLVKSFTKLGIDAYGIDISSYAINNCLSEVRSKLKLCDIEREKLPFRDDSLDVVIMTEVIEHLREVEFVMKEIKRVLKPEGSIYLTAPTPKWKLDDPTHINMHDVDFWSQFFKKCGFNFEFLSFIESPDARDVIEMLNPEKNRILQSKMGKLIIKAFSHLTLHLKPIAKLNTLISKMSFAIRCSELELVRIRVIMRKKKRD